MQQNHKKKHSHLRVVHLPDWSQGNPYQLLLAKGIKQAGWQVDFNNYPERRLALNQVACASSDIRAVHIHWITPYIESILWSSSKTRFLVKAALMVLDILLVRLKNKRVIWTIHNRVSHESRNALREAVLRRLIARCASHLIFHSEGARSAFREEITAVPLRKTTVIPHGNYVNVYRQDAALAKQLAERFSLTPKNTVILFFGAVRRYKGLPQLLEAFRQTTDPDLRLIIAGRPFEDELRQAVEDAASSDPRIKMYLDFIPDKEVAPLFSLASIIALPFETTLTSGSVLLAMSLGKALLLPEHAKVLDVTDEKGAIFYGSDDHLVSILCKLPSQSLYDMGAANLDIALQLRWDQIGKYTANLYGH